MSRNRRSGSEDPEDLFRRAMRDVEPLETKGGAAPPARRPPRPRRLPVGSGEAARRDAAGAVAGDLGAAAEGRDLPRRGDGSLAVEERIDLHGLSEEEGRAEVHRRLRLAAAAGRRLVLVIHGRGLRSPATPVLKTALPGWLAEPVLARQVVTHQPAPPGLGGAGATLVVLDARRRRRPRR